MGHKGTGVPVSEDQKDLHNTFMLQGFYTTLVV